MRPTSTRTAPFRGGRFWRDGVDVPRIVDAARAMLDAGAAIIDVGGESTRPGADPVDELAEIGRMHGGWNRRHHGGRDGHHGRWWRGDRGPAMMDEPQPDEDR